MCRAESNTVNGGQGERDGPGCAEESECRRERDYTQPSLAGTLKTNSADLFSRIVDTGFNIRYICVVRIFAA